MTTKLIKEALVHIASAAIFVLPVVAMADITKTNPVTGKTETYVNTFTGGADGTATEWNSAGNWDTGNVPFISSNYDPALVNGAVTVSTSTAIDGWALRVGAYNGAKVTWSGGITKIQAGEVGCWLTADETSSITLAFNGNNKQLQGSDAYPLKLSSAKADGITWTSGLADAGNTSLPFWYYLKGAGTVAYGGDITVANAQVIKQADVTLSGTSQVASKTLVSFGSGTTKTFTADAEIKVYGTDGTTLKKIVAVGSVRAARTAMENASSILTTADPVGSCEIVQCTDGIVLYYVDGDYPSSAAYKPSISVNFCHGNAPLITSADVGYGDYAVPGMFWNNMVSAGGNDGTFTTPLSTIRGIKSTGEPTLVSGASVAVSGTRGSWSCGSVAAAKDLRQGYVDDAAGANASPQVAISGIPYYSYYAVVYFSNNDPNVKFGYVTINGTNYKWDSDKNALAECEGAASDMWGASSPTAWTEGGNYIVTPTFVNSDGNFTIVGHRLTSGGVTARSGIAAIQIVEVPKVAEEGELVINVSGDTTYTVDANAMYTTVYATGTGTLSFSGSGVITTTTFNIGNGVTMSMDTTHLSPTTVTGSGTIVYDGSQPSTTLGFNDSSNWFGTVWVKNVGTGGESTDSKVGTCLGSSSGTAEQNTLNNWGNSSSFVKFTNVRGYMSTANVPWTLVLEDDGDTKAWYNNNGWTDRSITIAALKGDGSIWDINDSGCRPFLNFGDASQFTGTIKVLGKQVFLNDTSNTGSGTSLSAGRITVSANLSLTVASGKTWYTRNGLVVNGTLNVNGTLASDSTTDAVTGSGTVVFTGRAPTPTGDAWWKNANWTGTVELNAATAIAGWEFNNYGHSGSTLRLNNCRGWLKNNYTCAPALEIGGVFTWNDGSSGLNNTFKVGTLKGSGTISIPTGGAPTAVWQITDDWSGFTGAVVGNNTDGRRVLVFGPTLPATVEAGEIYVSDGATLNLGNASAAWWTLGKGFVVDGTVVSPNRDKWGGGTAMTLGDTGVLEMVSTGNKEDYADYSGVIGTGTIKYSSTAGWRTFPVDDAKAPPTTLTVQVELADSLIITRDAGRETVIGNLAGSKNIRSDWNPSGSGSANHARTLTVTQAKDTEWQGKFVSNRITQFNVNPGASTTGTLTLSGTHTVSIPLTVSGSVNLTGTWVGDTTVSGTIGGTGTLTGDLTFNAGSTFKAFASDGDDGLYVSDTIAYPESGTVAVDVSALGLTDSSGWVTLITAPGLDKSKFAPSDADKYKIRVTGNQLQARTRVKKFCVIVR